MGAMELVAKTPDVAVAIGRRANVPKQDALHTLLILGGSHRARSDRLVYSSARNLRNNYSFQKTTGVISKMSLPTYIMLDGNVEVLTENNQIDIHTGKEGNTAFVVDYGNVGDDIIEYFGTDDSLLTRAKIFDGNKDGFIGFGSNGLLDIDRTSARKAGNDQLSILDNGASVKELRYLGEAGGQYAYAAASTWHHFRTIDKNGFEGTIGNDEIRLNGGALLIDNALGLHTGRDTLVDGAAGTRLVTTAKLEDEDSDGFADGLDIGASSTMIDINGPGGNPIGAVILAGSYVSGLKLTDTMHVDGQTFYVYTATAP
jgi:hypothetical protein